MFNRGQVTVFIIVGILILFITAGIFFVVRSTTTEQLTAVQGETPLASDFGSLQSFVNRCLQQTATDGVRYIGFRGGYYTVHPPFNDLLFFQLPYYFDLGQQQFPSKTVIAQQMESYVEENLDTCLRNFTLFTKEGFSFNQGEKDVG